MKFKKFFLGVFIGILAVASLALGACSNDSGNDDEDKDNGPVTISYQLSGVMDGEDLDSFSFAKGAFWLKLMSDGSIVMDRYSFGNYNTSPAAENDDYIQNYMQGEWEESTRDGVEALSIEIYVLNEAGIKTQSSSATAYNSNGTYTCSLRMEVVSGAGFFRQVSFSGGTTLYADADEFIADNAKEFVPPQSVTTFTAEGGTVYVQEGGTALIYSGYSQVAEATYANDGEGNMTVTVVGQTIDVTVDTANNTASFEYEYAIYGDYTTVYSFTCADYSAIPVVGAQTPAGDVYTGTYSSMVWTLTILDDTSCTIGANMGGFNVVFNCTYAEDADGALTLTTVDMPEAYAPAWAAIDGVKWQLADDNTMTAIAPATSQG